MVRTGLIVGLATTVGLVTVARLAGTESGGGHAAAPVVARAETPEPAPEAAPAPPVIATLDLAAAMSGAKPGAKAAPPVSGKAIAVQKTFKVNETDQVFAVRGQGFEKGLTATLVAPLGLTTTFPASAVGELSTTSFTIRLMLDEPGTYLFSVRNENGARSASHQIVVKR
jgi:hypothetical protein